jgi:hypothetical protein
MLDVGGLEVIVVLVMWVVPAFIVYWIIRLGVRHGTLDAYRIDRTDQRIAAMKADIRERRAADSPASE